jgi:hypothetical protein
VACHEFGESCKLVGDSLPCWLIFKLKRNGIELGLGRANKNLGRSEHGRAEKGQRHPKVATVAMPDFCSGSSAMGRGLMPPFWPPLQRADWGACGGRRKPSRIRHGLGRDERGGVSILPHRYIAATVSRDGAVHFVCMDWRHMDDISIVGRTIYGERQNLCIWNKSNAGTGSLYRSKHELVFCLSGRNGT